MARRSAQGQGLVQVVVALALAAPLLVRLKDGQDGTKEEFLAFLEGKIAKWWTPDDVVFVDDIPLGATGKIDKKLIRDRMKDYVLPGAKAVEKA